MSNNAEKLEVHKIALSHGDAYGEGCEWGKNAKEAYLGKDRYKSHSIRDLLSQFGDNKPVVYLIDMFNFGYRFAYGGYSKKLFHHTKDGYVPVSVPDGTRRLISSIGIDHGLRYGDDVPKIIICIYDVPCKAKKKADKSYKANRTAESKNHVYLNDAIKYSALYAASTFGHTYAACADGREADDVMNAIASELSNGSLKDAHTHTYICSRDQDLKWYISDRATGYAGTMFTMKHHGEFIKPAQVTDKFGVPPHKLMFRKILCGKASDNWKVIIGVEDSIRFINSHDELTLDNLEELVTKEFKLSDKKIEKIRERIKVIKDGVEIDKYFILSGSDPAKFNRPEYNPFSVLLDPKNIHIEWDDFPYKEVR
jgi:hypothetical protein